MMLLSDVSQYCGGSLVGTDRPVRGLCIDSRSIHANELYVAIIGERLNGHRFIAAAESAGAAALLVSETPTDSVLPHILVPDTCRALGDIAAAWRRKFSLPIIGVTGSNGKTTVKEMIAAICRQKCTGLVSTRNLNNHIGVPLNLLQLNDGHQWAVIEMGMNHPGEIRYLSKLTRPDVALITNAAPAHLGGLGTVRDVAAAKAEIFSGLATNGTAILNADDEFYDYWRQHLQHRKHISFGFSEAADVQVSCSTSLDHSDIELKFNGQSLSCRLGLPGEHNAGNAAAAAAAGLAVGMAAGHLKKGLESLQAVAGRLQWLAGRDGNYLLDDSYNANPASLGVALQVLAGAEGEKILLLGDMVELGAKAAEFHRAAGKQAKAMGIAYLLSYGDLSALASQAFGAGGRHFDTREQLLNFLQTLPGQGKTILVKGSRSMAMEWFCQQLASPPEEQNTTLTQGGNG